MLALTWVYMLVLWFDCDNLFTGCFRCLVGWYFTFRWGLLVIVAFCVLYWFALLMILAFVISVAF